jgi:hypothetical protein
MYYCSVMAEQEQELIAMAVLVQYSVVDGSV